MIIIKFDIVVIGGGPAGWTAAWTARKVYADKSVCLIRREEKAIIPCAIPYVFGLLSSIDDNILTDKPLLKNGVNIIIGEVVDVNAQEKYIVLKDGRKISYDKLILATGSKPRILHIKGSDLEGVFYVYKSYDYLKKAREFIDKAKTIVIIGGGLTGVEIADTLATIGKSVYIVECNGHILHLNFDEDFVVFLENELKRKGVNLICNRRVSEIVGSNGKVKGVILDNGEKISCDAVIIAAGTMPESSLASKTGIVTDEKGYIIVDAYYRTNIPDIYAIGDCIQKLDYITGRRTEIMLSSLAAYEARICVLNLYGHKVTRRKLGVIPTCLTKVGEVYAASAGLTERRAKTEGFNVVVGRFETINRHPGKLPGARKTIIKLVFEEGSLRLIGGEVLGSECVGEIVNALTLAMLNNYTAYDLVQLQYGTQPTMTPSPIANIIVNAALRALLS